MKKEPTPEETIRSLSDALQQKQGELEEALTNLKNIQTQLLFAEKMASLGELTAGIAHEIKNPLNFVNNFADIVRELVADLRELFEANRSKRIADAQDAIEMILMDLDMNAKRIVEHGKRADSIVRGMMRHARGGTGEKISCNINQLLDEAVNLAYHGMRAQQTGFNVAIEKDFDTAVPVIQIMQQEVSRVVLNLLNNAFYAVNERREHSDAAYRPAVSVTSRFEPPAIEIRVKDNGTGIPEEIRRKIFEPFYTTKPAGKGTGLGLSLSHDIIVKTHGGELTVNSREGEGTEFVIRLPGV